MSMVAFFPWLKIKRDFDLGDIELKIFKVSGQQEVTENGRQIIYDKVIKHYLDSSNNLIEKCTIVLKKNKNILEDIDENERDFLFSFAEILAFSGLSKREFFGFGFGYCNRDNFSFVIQSFTKDSDGVTIVTRRRDGSTKNFISGDAYKVTMPFNITSNEVEIDINLAKALLQLPKKSPDIWPRFSDAIFFFNRANTDSDQITEHQEIVMTISAFERLLDCRGGSEKELVKKFLKVFTTEDCLDFSQSKRLKNSGFKVNDKTLKEIWLRDFFRIRGEYAHGKRSSKRPIIWLPYEHLLLGAYVFPLLLKILLSKYGFYKLIEDDIDDINLFEQLAGADIFKKPKDSGSWEWDRIRSDYKFNKNIERAYEKAKKEFKSD